MTVLGHRMCLCDSWYNCSLCTFMYFGHCADTAGAVGYEGRLCLLGEEQSMPQGKMFAPVE